jgi:hypothetical protein
MLPVSESRLSLHRVTLMEHSNKLHRCLYLSDVFDGVLEDPVNANFVRHVAKELRSISLLSMNQSAAKAILSIYLFFCLFVSRKPKFCDLIPELS